MFELRHIALISKGDISILREFYKVIIKPYSVIEKMEEGEILDSIIGIKNAKIVTCKLFSKNINIEIIKYLNPIAKVNQFNIPAFTGLNHIAFTVDNFEEAKKLILNSGGSCIKNKVPKITGGNVKFAQYFKDPENNFLEIVEI